MSSIEHADYTKAICDVAGILFWLATHEPQPDGRRGVLEHIRAVVDAVIGPSEDPKEPPEMPPGTVDLYVQSSNGEDVWIHHPVRFNSEAEAHCWAREGCYRWNRIQRVETSYILVDRTG